MCNATLFGSQPCLPQRRENPTAFSCVLPQKKKLLHVTSCFPHSSTWGNGGREEGGGRKRGRERRRRRGEKRRRRRGEQPPALGHRFFNRTLNYSFCHSTIWNSRHLYYNLRLCWARFRALLETKQFSQLRDWDMPLSNLIVCCPISGTVPCFFQIHVSVGIRSDGKFPVSSSVREGLSCLRKTSCTLRLSMPLSCKRLPASSVGL